jgi:ATP-binding cassette subfamily A (ABC1) protein 3
MPSHTISSPKSDGQLRCVGSSLFLKKTYGVGYQLTIEKQQVPGQDSSANDTKLEVIVEGNVSEASLLSNVGAEMSYQLPIAAASKFVPMLNQSLRRRDHEWFG